MSVNKRSFQGRLRQIADNARQAENDAMAAGILAEGESPWHGCGVSVVGNEVLIEIPAVALVVEVVGEHLQVVVDGTRQSLEAFLTQHPDREPDLAAAACEVSKQVVLTQVGLEREAREALRERERQARIAEMVARITEPA